jgi:hypothetical protein
MLYYIEVSPRYSLAQYAERLPNGTTEEQARAAYAERCKVTTDGRHAIALWCMPEDSHVFSGRCNRIAR